MLATGNVEIVEYSPTVFGQYTLRVSLYDGQDVPAIYAVAWRID